MTSTEGDGGGVVVVLDEVVGLVEVVGDVVLCEPMIGALVNRIGVCAAGRYVYPNIPPAPRVG